MGLSEDGSWAHPLISRAHIHTRVYNGSAVLPQLMVLGVSPLLTAYPTYHIIRWSFAFKIVLPILLWVGGTTPGEQFFF